MFSPDGNNIAYIAQREQKSFIVKNNIEGEKYDSIQLAIDFSPDGKSIGFLASRGKEYYAVMQSFDE